MFKINRQSVSNMVSGVKNGFRSAVGHAVKFASTLPKHYQTAKKMLGAQETFAHELGSPLGGPSLKFKSQSCGKLESWSVWVGKQNCVEFCCVCDV